MTSRRQFMSSGLAAGVLARSIDRALALPATVRAGSLQDVQHVVILMMENRGFDHYFGSLRGVRGFGDRHPVPLESGKPVWFQSDGHREIPPYHLDTHTTSALRVPSTPHSFDNAQAAWNQGKFGFWPKFKTEYAMGHYRRADLPFQFALAEAFTICDAYHCSVTSGTDPNRIAFWSGSNFDPVQRARGINCTDADAEPDNLRCWITGALPQPGYTYAGNALTWPTIPEILEHAKVSWRIYQDPNDNWTGAMHGGLAFAGFRNAKPGSPLYEKGMRDWSLEQFADDARTGRLPQVSWVLPPERWSEHPEPSSPAQGAEFTARVLDALTQAPQTWGKTALFLTFDENDGTFDHVPPPAPPSFDPDGMPAGGATLDLAGHYFSDPQRKHLLAGDKISGTVRPWGLGPRVPMVVISPWSKGGWVNSQTFDHSSVAQFLEKRFGVTVPGISPWHRAVCGDLTSAFDFRTPNDVTAPQLPNARDAATRVAAAEKLPKPVAPDRPEGLVHESGARPSRALPYILSVTPRQTAGHALQLAFGNDGAAGCVFHVYDRLHLDRIPRRYTVEAGKQMADAWAAEPDGRYDLWVLGPNGFLRSFQGGLAAAAWLDVELHYHPVAREIELQLTQHGEMGPVSLVSNVYRPSTVKKLPGNMGKMIRQRWSVHDSGNWYDLTLRAQAFEWRFAGRMETGLPGVSDPAV